MDTLFNKSIADDEEFNNVQFVLNSESKNNNVVSNQFKTSKFINKQPSLSKVK